MRYTGSKAKRCRAVGMNLYGNEKFDRLKRPYPPGQHGQSHKKRSEFADHLLEKQKIKWTYGVTERQLVRLYEEASKAKEVTGTLLLQLLERRLDNVLFRSGLFASRDQARQLISHGHVSVNEHRISIASCRLRPGDVVSIREKSRAFVNALIGNRSNLRPDWISVDEQNLSVTVLAIPMREQLDQSFHENLLVEFYSR